ncbi:hypothetical protein VPH35_119080 [Triticum aestivum]
MAPLTSRVATGCWIDPAPPTASGRPTHGAKASPTGAPHLKLSTALHAVRRRRERGAIRLHPIKERGTGKDVGPVGAAVPRSSSTVQYAGEGCAVHWSAFRPAAARSG